MPNDTYNDYGTPLSRTELYLQQIAENTSGGGGGGSGGGVLVVGADLDTLTLDKTWQKINDADFAVLRVGSEGDWQISWLSAIYEESSVFYVLFYSALSNDTMTFVADSADGYPVMQQDGGGDGGQDGGGGD